MLVPGKWTKAKISNSQGNCVEVYWDPLRKEILVRDTKDKGEGRKLRFYPDEWESLTRQIKENPIGFVA